MIQITILIALIVFIASLKAQFYMLFETGEILSMFEKDGKHMCLYRLNDKSIDVCEYDKSMFTRMKMGSEMTFMIFQNVYGKKIRAKVWSYGENYVDCNDFY